MEIFLYTLSVMYSPGPVNFMGLNSGLTGQFKKTIYFFMGVGCAMLMKELPRPLVIEQAIRIVQPAR